MDTACGTALSLSSAFIWTVLTAPSLASLLFHSCELTFTESALDTTVLRQCYIYNLPITMI